ncbi:MAG: ribonuclease J [Candidatus Levybacteria bacterium]|nr:ribonuclease J [Candidatus Levybacteria bacterium]
MEKQITPQPVHHQKNAQSVPADTVSFLPLGGLEDVTKNLYLYEYKDEILIVDCGIGFADSSMLGVDLLIPDISYLLTTKKKIVGLLLTHGHEDHIGAIPFILPQLPKMPVYATPFTAALANEKLRELELPADVRSVSFGDKPITLGSFSCSFIHVTHSVPDSANIFIRTPVGNFYHGSDFKIDLTPYDKKRMDFESIANFAKEGVMVHLSDSLGSDRQGQTPSDQGIGKSFERALSECKGKFILTTYSSNVARINQIIAAAEKYGRKVCLVGRSLVKVTDVAKRIGYLQVQDGTLIELAQASNYPDNKLVYIAAGSQGQENSALTRIAEGEHREIHLTKDDVVVFSSDPIPGNEEAVNSLIDSIAKTGAHAITSQQGALLHVSGHGSIQDHYMMMSLLKGKFVIPISGNYKHLVYYKELALKLDYPEKNVLIIENGQEIIFWKDGYKKGRKIPMKNVYVDQVSGGEIEGFVLRDREKLAKDGILILMIEVSAANGQLVDRPDFIVRGLLPADAKLIETGLAHELKNILATKKGRVTNWVHTRKQIEETASKYIFKRLRKRPLVLPVVIEV